MQRREVRSPFDGRVVGSVDLADAADLDAAVHQVSRAFDETRRLAAYERADLLDRIRSLISLERDGLAKTIALESGKTIREARREVERCEFTFGAARDEVRRLGGEVIPLDAFAPGRGHVGMLRRFPAGPVLGITPFNFPLNLVAHKIAPALAAGCSILIKPSTATPLTALRLAALVRQAGAPEHSVTVLPCRAATADALIADHRFRVISFTGSPQVGWSLKSRAGRKRVLLELGGNAAVVVHEDADVHEAVSRIVPAAFGQAGQSCISVQRILLHRSIATQASEALVARTRALRTGDPLDETTDVGPLIDEDAASRLEMWVAQAVDAGARILCGGKRQGTLMEPTLLANVPPTLPLVCGEAFGPVAVISTYDSFERALEQVNDSDYGLQAGLFTNDLTRAMKALETLEVGAVMVNQVPTWRIDHMPYGGTKGSGVGREGPRYAIEDYTEPRLLVLNLGKSK